MSGPDGQSRGDGHQDAGCRETRTNNKHVIESPHFLPQTANVTLRQQPEQSSIRRIGRCLQSQ